MRLQRVYVVWTCALVDGALTLVAPLRGPVAVGPPPGAGYGRTPYGSGPYGR